MQCPTDGTVLTMSERSGIEIDYCPTCRGVWLDRGELDKILERSVQQAPAAAPPPGPPGPSGPQQPSDSGHDLGREQSYQQQGYRKPKRKESWLSEIFD